MAIPNMVVNRCGAKIEQSAWGGLQQSHEWIYSIQGPYGLLKALNIYRSNL